MNDDKIRIIYVTCPDKEEAKKIAHALVEKKLVASANMLPVESIYYWKGELKEDNEVILLAKTLKEKVKDVVEEVKNIHSYEIPCILTLKARPNIEYMNWVGSQVN